MTKVLISAGHFPTDPGAIIPGKFVEHDEAILWRNRIVELLDGEAGKVATGTLRQKVGFINRKNPLLAVEIHFNDAGIDKNGDGILQEEEHFGRGCETLYCPGSTKGRSTADLIQRDLSRVFPPDRGVKEGYYKMNPANGPDYFLSATRCVALIIEPEFVVNHEKIVFHREAGCAVIATALRTAIAALASY